jgi:c-di-GMP-binding flagellar brake protein YcgR
MSLPDRPEKRTAPRYQVHILMKFRLVKSPDGETPETELHNGNNLIANLSRTGFFLSTKNYMDVGCVLEVEFTPPDPAETVRAYAEVVRANYQNFPNQGRYEYGIEFKDMNPRSRENLDRFLAIFVL